MICCALYSTVDVSLLYRCLGTVAVTNIKAAIVWINNNLNKPTMYYLYLSSDKMSVKPILLCAYCAAHLVRTCDKVTQKDDSWKIRQKDSGDGTYCRRHDNFRHALQGARNDRIMGTKKPSTGYASTRPHNSTGSWLSTVADTDTKDTLIWFGNPAAGTDTQIH
jgi:hypothetical protein